MAQPYECKSLACLGSFADLAQDENGDVVVGRRAGCRAMFSLKVHAIITGALFAAIIVTALIGNVLHDQGLLADSSAAQVAARVIFFTLFLAFAYSTVPLMVKIVLAGQVKIGNGDVGIVRAVTKHQTRVVIAFWVLISLGLAIAIPAAIQDGFFDPEPELTKPEK
jgi:hypothetical protein